MAPKSAAITARTATIAPAGLKPSVSRRCIVARYRNNAKRAIRMPIAINPTPMPKETPLSRAALPWRRRNSRKVIPNFATTKPNTMMLMLVRIHARKVRSFQDGLPLYRFCCIGLASSFERDRWQVTRLREYSRQEKYLQSRSPRHISKTRVGSHIFLSHSVKRVRSCSFGQRLAAAITLASITLPSEDSPPRRLTNPMNTLHAEHRFRPI